LITIAGRISPQQEIFVRTSASALSGLSGKNGKRELLPGIIHGTKTDDPYC
jgi:hypothetical protein